MAKLLTRAGRSLLGGNGIEVYDDRLVIGGLLNRTEIRLADLASVGLSKAPGLLGRRGQLDLFVRGRPNPVYSIPFTPGYEREFDEAKSVIDRLIFGAQQNYALNVGRLFTSNELLGGVIDVAVNELLKEFNLTPVPEDKTVIVSDGEVTRPTEPVAPQPGVTPEMAELEKWAACRDKGMITKEEYEFKKKQLLYGTRDSDGKIQRLIPCDYCGTVFDADENAKCPSCGAPLKKN